MNSILCSLPFDSIIAFRPTNLPIMLLEFLVLLQPAWPSMHSTCSMLPPPGLLIGRALELLYLSSVDQASLGIAT